MTGILQKSTAIKLILTDPRGILAACSAEACNFCVSILPTHVSKFQPQTTPFPLNTHSLFNISLILIIAIAPGDPTTIGYPSKPGCVRQDTNLTTPSIPSIPISYRDALPILRALNGHGPTAKSFGKYWDRGGLYYKGIDYNIGPSPE